MNKKNKKKLHYFTLTQEFEKIFEEFIELNSIDKSKLIEKILIEYIEKNNKLKND